MQLKHSGFVRNIFYFAIFVLMIGQLLGAPKLHDITPITEKNLNPKAIDALLQKIGSTLSSTKQLPSEVMVEKRKYSITYTINDNLNTFVKNLLKKFRSDYSAVVIIENDTGRIISAASFVRSSNSFNEYLPFSSTHPAASLFKMITAADLLESGKVGPETNIQFSGRTTTLYRYQIDDSRRKWVRNQRFDHAFACSNNPVFAKAAIGNLSGSSLFNMATRFGFNDDILLDLPMNKSVVHLPVDDYDIAEMASGFNTDTLISPVHAAVLASTIANDGVLRYPKVIKQVSDSNSSENLWSEIIKEKTVLPNDINDEMKHLMRLTIKQGTAKKGFRRFNRRLLEDLDIGGKTGSITGGLPFGKRDWFSVFAVPRDEDRGKGISIGIMNINVGSWHIRSSVIGKEIIEYYFKNIDRL